MTTVISSHVKDKNRIFTGYEKSWYFIGVYVINVSSNNNRQFLQNTKDNQSTQTKMK